MKAPLWLAVLGFLILWCCKAVVPASGSISSMEVPVPADNLQNERKIALGKKLFFDPSLSLDSSISCASCHRPELAFTDGLALSTGVKGRKANRNAPSLLNVGFSPVLMFDGEINTLEKQAGVPIQEHSEMDMNMRELISRLRKNNWYVAEAKAVFNREFDPWVLTRSLAAYQRTIVSSEAPFDAYYYGKKAKKMSRKAVEGWELFSKKLKCTACHAPPFFTTYEVANNGLVNLKEKDLGRWRIHYDSSDIGKFKIPTLRNLKLTAPYMHDGRFAQIEEVIEFYSRGGNQVFNQDQRIKAFELNAEEREALKVFLIQGLLDQNYLKP